MAMTEQLTGVWTSAVGTRVEIDYQDGVWRAWAYMSRRGGQPSRTFEFDTVDKVRDAIRGLESQGNVHQPGWLPDGPRTWGEGVKAQWSSPAHLIGAALLFALILIVGVALIS